MYKFLSIMSYVWLVLMVIWIIVEHYKVKNYTTLTKPTTAYKGGVEGTYRRVSPSGLGSLVDHVPFSSEIIIVSLSDNGIAVKEMNGQECEREHHFNIGSNIWWKDAHSAEFQISRIPSMTALARNVGYFRAMVEGGMTFDKNGNINIESVHWERAMAGYSVPMSMQSGPLKMTFERVNPTAEH